MTGNQLKIIALVAMTLDHIGYILLPQLTFLRIIGRLAFPVFAYMLAEGCFYTHDKRRYLAGLLVLAVIVQIACYAAAGVLAQQIPTTLALGVLTVFGLQCAGARRDVRGAAALVGALALDAFACLALPHLLRGWSIDYGIFGVLLPAFAYLPRILWPQLSDASLRRRMLVGCAVALLGVSWCMGGRQWFCLLALVLLAFYNGKRGTWRMKHLFYIYYPAHLAVLWGLSALL